MFGVALLLFDAFDFLNNVYPAPIIATAAVIPKAIFPPLDIHVPLVAVVPPVTGGLVVVPPLLIIS